MTTHRLLAAAGLALASLTAWAQGQDSTPVERDIMVIAEMLPGIYDDVEQVYFDQRRKLPEAARHTRARLAITRVPAPAFGERVFFVKESLAPDLDKPTLLRLYALSVDNAESAVRMRIFDLGDPGTSPYRTADSDPGVLAGLVPANAKSEPECDVLWRREAGQFHATGLPTCRGEAKGRKLRRELDMMLDARSLWIRSRRVADDGELLAGPVDGVHYKFNRARQFQCHADMPGVGGGRNEPFKRYGPFAVLDQGGEVTFRPDEGSAREVNFSLRSVDWAVNNETGAFTRDVLALYVSEKLADGKAGASGYSFTEPTVRRTGINLGWILVMCYMESNRQARPEF